MKICLFSPSILKLDGMRCLFDPPAVPLVPKNNENNEDHHEPVVEDDQESMAMNASDNSLSSNNVQHMGLDLALNNQPILDVELNFLWAECTLSLAQFFLL
jgi:hypothetical protein